MLVWHNENDFHLSSGQYMYRKPVAFLLCLRSNDHFCTSCGFHLPQKTYLWEVKHFRYLWATSGRSDPVFYMSEKGIHFFVNMYKEVFSVQFNLNFVYTQESEYANMPDTKNKNTAVNSRF